MFNITRDPTCVKLPLSSSRFVCTEKSCDKILVRLAQLHSLNSFYKSLMTTNVRSYLSASYSVD